MTSDTRFSMPPGTLRLAQIVKYDVATRKAKITISTRGETIDPDSNTATIELPVPFYSDDGLFIGALVKEKTPIVVARGEGGKWFFVSYLITQQANIPNLVPGQILIQSSINSKITLDKSNNIYLGSDTDRLHLYVNKNDLSETIFSSNFNNTFNFTEASRSVNGIVKRETSRLKDYPSQLKLESDDYSSKIWAIGLDPKVTKSATFIGQVKNPPFAEKREMVYEFAYNYNVGDDLTESQLYNKQGVKSTDTYSTTNRRQSRSDTLSLSLVAPNYLMETVKGTVIDIFGNILDINRNPIPIGTKNLTLKPESSGALASDVFASIKEAERRSVAYHFELNARKNLAINKDGATLLNLIDINSTADYARNRSRFFFDLDKEGQFKLNVPASSETGNVPLLVRYENYSTVGDEENGNPNKLIYRDDNLDILLDSFANQEIDIMDGDAVATPQDRITQDHLKKGMPFHPILSSLTTFQDDTASQWLDIQYVQTVDLNAIPTITNVVSPTINVSGSKANAGGRSGSAHFDGSIEFSIGANTVDRQSLWIDTAGGMIGNFGRDLNNVSAGLSLDGDLLLQIGGNGISTDSRFNNINNAYRGGALDIRVMNDGFTVSIVRIDKNGVTIVTPNTLTLKGRDINISADGNLILEGDNVSINDRFVAKYPAGSI